MLRLNYFSIFTYCIGCCAVLQYGFLPHHRQIKTAQKVFDRLDRLIRLLVCLKCAYKLPIAIFKFECCFIFFIFFQYFNLNYDKIKILNDDGSTNMIELIVLVGIILLFIVMGTYLMQGRGAFLIAGYNTMPQEEQNQYDIRSLCRFMGKTMYVFSLCMVFYLVGELFQSNWPFYIGTALMVGTIIFMLIYMNTGDRFKKQ